MLWSTWQTVLLLAGAGTVLAAPSEKLWSRQTVVSKNGKCGRTNHSYLTKTCKGSEFGPCCSQYGWCGSSKAYCDSGCNPLYGDCTNQSSSTKSTSLVRSSSSFKSTTTAAPSSSVKPASSSLLSSSAKPASSVSKSASTSVSLVSSSLKPASSSPMLSVSSSKIASLSTALSVSSSRLASSATGSAASSPKPVSSSATSVVSSPKSALSSSTTSPSSLKPVSSSTVLSISTSKSASVSTGPTLSTSKFPPSSATSVAPSSKSASGSSALVSSVSTSNSASLSVTTSPSSAITLSSVVSPSFNSSSSSGITSLSNTASTSSSFSASSASSFSNSSTSTAPTCSSTPVPSQGTLPNCIRCQGQPGADQYCGYTIDSDYQQVTPKTCRVVSYEWDITETTIAPDGIPRFAMVVNGQMPGPAIQANWGDTVVVKVNNKLSQNGTSIHFHGIRQFNNNMNDGVPSITQCPIAPGQSMTYTWVAEQYGTTWWHSHFALQTWEGIFGSIIINGPTTKSYDEDLGALFLQDWSHQTVDELYQLAENATINAATGATFGGPQTMDNGLLNGKNTWGSNGTSVGQRYQVNNIQSGKSYRLRIVNSAIQSTFKFYIDGHSFDVIAMDLVPIIPYTTNILNINIGQRYDIVVHADQPAGVYWMRADNQESCAHTIQNRDTKGIFAYNGFSGTPTTTAYNYTDECVDEPYASLVPHLAINAGPADIIEPTLDVVVANNGADLFKWYLNGNTFFSQYNDPTLLEIWQSNTLTNYSGSLLIPLPNEGKMVYVIIESPIPLPHPIHLHGHDFWVLAAGTGSYDSSVPLKLDNPPRRDTVLMPSAGFVVIGFKTDNPGVWLAHCHIGWHVAMGFALQFVEMQNKIVSSGAVNSSCTLTGNCQTWRQYATANNIQVLDSGV